MKTIAKPEFFYVRILIFLFAFFIIVNKAFSQGEWKVVNTTTKPEARFGHSLTTLPDGKVLLIGGENSSMDMYNDLYSYDNGEWGPVTVNDKKMSPRAGHSTWIINGKVYVHGGRGKKQGMGEEVLKDTWSYNPQTKEWSEVKTVTSPGPRSEHKASSHPDGYALISGGINENGVSLNEIWKFNDKEQYSLLTNSLFPVSEHISEIVDDKLYLLSEFNRVQIYDLKTNTWTTNQQGPPNCYNASSAVGQNSKGEKIIFVFGGFDENGISDAVYEYNTATNTTTKRATSMPKRIAKGACAKIKGGMKRIAFLNDYEYLQVLHFGGLNTSSKLDSTTLEFTVGEPTSISENSENEDVCLIISPDSRYITFKINETEFQKQNLSCIIYNQLGQQIKFSEINQPEAVINIEELTKALYLVRIPKLNYTAKFLKE